MRDSDLNSFISGWIETAKRAAGFKDKQMAMAAGIAESTLYNKRSQETLPTLSMRAFVAMMEIGGFEVFIRRKEK